MIFQCTLCDEGGEDGGDKGKKHHEKIKKCMKQTMDLTPCCPYPKDESAKDDPDCKHHLEGIEGMEKKEKHKAYKCFTDCIFTKNGLLVDGELVKEKIHEMTNQMLEKLEGDDWNEITTQSVDYCLDECKQNDLIR